MSSFLLIAQFIGSFSGGQIPVYNKQLVEAVKAQTRDTVVYDGSYYVLKYPGGDVPKGIGVCTDVVIRAYRAIGFDLQQLIHEDMKKAFAVYNKRRKSNKIDASIDHRRTPNMQTFFTRQGAKLPVTNDEEDYIPGDIIFWDVAYSHVGMVVDEKVPGTNHFYIVHNICCGNNMEDFLFGAKIVDHYRWDPASKH
jgi:uncharacterized protein YijF (DUF1287 family)